MKHDEEGNGDRAPSSSIVSQRGFLLLFEFLIHRIAQTAIKTQHKAILSDWGNLGELQVDAETE